MNAEAAKGCKERASTYERRGRKEMLAVLTTHRVTRAVLVLVVCVCSIRLAGPALCATMTGMADSSQRRADAAVDPPGIRPDDRSWRAHARGPRRADRRGDPDDDA